MKFALVDGERREAQTGLAARCPACGSAVIAKCGSLRVWHWAHRGLRTCDHWWEPETEWHRAWKNCFTKAWQETIHTSDDGEKHIADVKTESGMVIEFQHSFLCQDERVSRERFYRDMVWVVNGRRRKRDMQQFFASLGAPIIVNDRLRIFSAPPNESALLRDWETSRVPVYFDFNTSALWRLNPRGSNDRAYLSPVPNKYFLRVNIEGQPFEGKCTRIVDRAVADHLMRQVPRSRPLTGFERYLARKERERPRF